jgi:hypothetical protein
MFFEFVCWSTRVDDVSLLVPKETPSNRSTRSPKLAAEPTLLRVIGVDHSFLTEPTYDVDVAVVGVNASAVELEQIGSDWRKVPCVPTWKSKLPIARSTTRLKLLKARRCAGGGRRKSIEPKHT